MLSVAVCYVFFQCSLFVLFILISSCIGADFRLAVIPTINRYLVMVVLMLRKAEKVGGVYRVKSINFVDIY